MSRRLHRGGWIIVLSLFIALLLTILPLPNKIELLRPEWVLMVLIYWCLAIPERIGIGTAWGLGLLVDVVRDATLGQYALALALIAFITLKLYRRIRVFPLWQQALAIFLLVLIQSMIVLWVKGITGQAPNPWLVLASAFTSTLLWPLVFLALRYARRRYQVS